MAGVARNLARGLQIFGFGRSDTVHRPRRTAGTMARRRTPPWGAEPREVAQKPLFLDSTRATSTSLCGWRLRARPSKAQQRASSQPVYKRCSHAAVVRWQRHRQGCAISSSATTLVKRARVAPQICVKSAGSASMMRHSLLNARCGSSTSPLGVVNNGH